MEEREEPATDAPSEPAGQEELAFEAALERLGQVVDRLEGGDLALEEALSTFEEGVRLSAHCAAQLDSAEQRLETLTKEGDHWVARPFEAETFEADEEEEDEDLD